MKQLCSAALLIAAFLGLANATPITYKVQLTTTGSLNGNHYVDLLTTLTMVGNTANVTGNAPYTNSIGTFSLSVGSLGTMTFTDQLMLLDNQDSHTVGFSDLTQGTFMLGLSANAFATYGLTSSIGPISGTPAIGMGNSFPTTAGSWILESTGRTGTFTATTAPEPLSAGLTCLGLIGLAWASARRRRNT